MANDVWTVQRCLDWTRDYLSGKGDERSRLSAEWLLSSVTGLSRTELYMSFDKPLAPEELSAMHAAVVRRAKGEPLQYVTGSTTFRMIDVACEPGVLIPRPETELLVEEVLTYLDREVLGAGNGNASARTRVELPWNAEVEAALRSERERAAQEREQGGDASGEHASVEKALESEGGGSGGAGDLPGSSGVDGLRAAAGHDFESAPVSEGAAPGDSDGEAASGADGAHIAEHAAEHVDEGSAACVASADACAVPAGEAQKPAAPRAARVLEVGCGTGCISLSLAHERAGRVECIATDIEPKAVELACRNRDALGILADAVDIRLGNLVSPLDRETEWGTFDVLVSNPPYIPSAVMETLPSEVSAFEPHVALDGGADGLDIFRRLVNAAPHMLRAHGLLACELYEGHLDEAADLCRAAGMENVRIVEDLAHRPRIILATIPAPASA